MCWKLTITATCSANNAKKPYGYDAEQNGHTHRGRRRWASAEARDKEIQRVARDFRARGFTVEVV